MDLNAEVATLQRVFDRLVSTPNDQLQKILDVLLPKLILMANNSDLREKVVLPMFSHILKRIKPLRTLIPIKSLIAQITSDSLPFGCNFAIAFVDTSMEWHPRELYDECAVSLVETLNRNSFKAFSAQSNALCGYALPLLGSLSSLGASISDSSKILLADWFLDVALTHPGLRKDVS
jgi:hypothetical protein